jgi:hypothetical protein
MQNTPRIIPSPSRPPTLREEFAEIDPIIGTVFVAGPPVLLAWAGTVLFALMLAGPFALLVTLVVVFAAAAALLVLAGAILAAPFLLVRHVRLRLAQRRQVSQAPATIATVVTAGAAR